MDCPCIECRKMGSGGSKKAHEKVNSTQAQHLFVTIFDSSPDRNIFADIQSIPSWQTLKVGRRDWSLLHLAVWKGNFHLAKQLINSGLSPHQPDNTGDTATDLAKELYDTDLLELLTEKERPTNSTVDVERIRSRELVEGSSNTSKVGNAAQIQPNSSADK